MRYEHFISSSRQAAIAAVMALSSTPLVAQTTAPVIVDPVIDAPAPVGSAPPAEQRAQQPVTVAPTVTLPATAAPPDAAPVVMQPALPPPDLSRLTDSSATGGARTPADRAVTGERAVVQPVPNAARTPSSLPPVANRRINADAPAGSAVTNAAAAAEASLAARASEAATPLPAPVAPSPEPIPAPALSDPPMEQTEASAVAGADPDVLPIVAGTGVILLAMAGGALLAMRRRRTPDEGANRLMDQPVDRDDRIAVAAPVAMPLGSEVTAARFDVSRYGRHVQAAYAGPTPDNPSLSLKRRLKRARFFDQRERHAQMAGAPVAAEVRQPVRPTAPALDQTAHVLKRPVRWNSGSFRPLFQN